MPGQDDTGYEGIRPATAEEVDAVMNGDDEAPTNDPFKRCMTSFRVIILEDGGMAAELDPTSEWAMMRMPTLNDIGPACWAIMTEAAAMRAAVHTMQAQQHMAQQLMQEQQAQHLMAKLDIPGMRVPNRQQRRHPGDS